MLNSELIKWIWVKSDLILGNVIKCQWMKKCMRRRNGFYWQYTHTRFIVLHCLNVTMYTICLYCTVQLEPSEKRPNFTTKILVPKSFPKFWKWLVRCNNARIYYSNAVCAYVEIRLTKVMTRPKNKKKIVYDFEPMRMTPSCRLLRSWCIHAHSRTNGRPY